MNNLKKLREEKKLTLRELSEKVRIDFSALSRAENGKRNLNDNDILILTKFFNVSSDYLLGLTNQKSKTISIKEQLSDIQLAFYNQVGEITDQQAKEVLQFIEFIKNRDGNK